MELKVKDRVIYESSFDEETGTLVRSIELGRDRYSGAWEGDEEFEKRYPHRHYGHMPFSPSPETVDVSITDKCNFGCAYCYQDSRPKFEHGRADLVETILLGFTHVPYQIAIGGGEPTLHPEFENILRTAREIGTVPNFTTAGDESLTDSIIDTANKVCGGVAMTFHAWKGIDWFVEHYTRLRAALKVQLNVHLIADKDVARNLNLLVDRADILGPLKLVLLAYYPSVGRATMDGLITKRVYTKDFPEALRRAQKEGFDIAFSEGLFPYFNSRPELRVDTRFASPSEGLYSCYFDPRGRISHSSFSPPYHEDPTCFEKTSQELWEQERSPYGPSGDMCDSCPRRTRCATPNDFHYLLCAFAEHNKAPIKPLPEDDAPTENIYQRLRTPKL